MSMEKLEKKQKNIRVLFGWILTVCLCSGLLAGCAFGAGKAKMAVLVLDVGQNAFKVSWKDKGMETIEQAKQANLQNLKEEGRANDALNKFEEATQEASQMQVPEGMEYINAYIEVIREELAEWNEYDYALIYLDEDDIPELVSGRRSYFINVYTFHEGQVFKLIDYWPYGAFGNTGYQYVPYGNNIRNYDADYAGLVMNVSFFKMNENFEIEQICHLQGAREDEEGNYSADVEMSTYYLYEDGSPIEITEAQFDSYLEQYDPGFVEREYIEVEEKDAIEMALELYSMVEGT